MNFIEENVVALNERWRLMQSPSNERLENQKFVKVNVGALERLSDNFKDHLQVIKRF